MTDGRSANSPTHTLSICPSCLDFGTVILFKAHYSSQPSLHSPFIASPIFDIPLRTFLAPVILICSSPTMALTPVRDKKALASSKSMLFFGRPTCHGEWQLTLQHVKSRFLKGHWKTCIVRCQQLLHQYPNTVSLSKAISYKVTHSNLLSSQMAYVLPICYSTPQSVTNRLVEACMTSRKQSSLISIKRERLIMLPPDHFPRRRESYGAKAGIPMQAQQGLEYQRAVKICGMKLRPRTNGFNDSPFLRLTSMGVRQALLGPRSEL